MSLRKTLTSEEIENERRESEGVKRDQIMREISATHENMFYRGMRFVGLGKLADYLTLRDYEEAKKEATLNVIARIPYGR